MHFTEPVYRNPYWPTWPLIQITQGCTHNRCKFCTMYKGVRFDVQPMEIIEEDLVELARTDPHARTIQLLSANPLALPFHRLASILEKINEYLPEVEHVYTQGRVSDLRNKTVDDLRKLKELGMNEISLGVESGDDWTLERIDKGYTSKDILDQCAKLDEAGIRYWVTFLNGVAGREHSHDHAVHTAEIFNQLNPMVIGTGGLTLFSGTPLLEEAKHGEFDPLDESDLAEELKTFIEHLNADCCFITHHTSTMNLTGPCFLERKSQIIEVLQNELDNGDLDRRATIRSHTSTL